MRRISFRNPQRRLSQPSSWKDCLRLWEVQKLLLVLLSLCALTGDSRGQPPEAVGKQQQITLATVSANYREGLLKLAREYEALHPGVQVHVQVQPPNGYETWLRTQIGTGSDTAPDIYNANYAIGFYERGLLVNLTPYMEQTNPYTNKPWKQNLDAQFLEKYKIGGDVAVLPLDFIEIAFFYNKDVFAKLGLKPPRTWEEMLSQADRIRKAGYIPFAVPGDADSYWSGTVGWIFRFFTDAYLRDAVPLVMSHPNDWDYNPRVNDGFKLDVSSPYNDATLIMNPERLIAAIRDKQIRMDSVRFQEAYTKIAEFASYWQRGFNGTNANSAYQLFLTHKAAMMLHASPTISQLEKDQSDLYPEDRFEWGVFSVPPLTQSRFHIPPFRGVGGAGAMWSVVKKNDAQTKLVTDFLMFTTTPHAAQTLVEEAVKARQSINGPLLIPGAKMPETMARHFNAFTNRGFEKLSFRGLADEQESVWKWTVWAQQYLDGRVSVDTCLKRYQETMLEAVPRVVHQMNYDMNPQTKDKVGK